jgi:hypothetical protein
MMRRLLIAITVIGALLAIGTAPVLAGNIHFVGTPTCTLVNGGTQVQCDGKIAGLGKAPTTVQIVAAGGCVNRPGHPPPGQVRGSSGPIDPRGGQITFSVETDPVSCPDQMTVVFGGNVLLQVFQNGTKVFEAVVPIT